MSCFTFECYICHVLCGLCRSHVNIKHTYMFYHVLCIMYILFGNAFNHGLPAIRICWILIPGNIEIEDGDKDELTFVFYLYVAGTGVHVLWYCIVNSRALKFSAIYYSGFSAPENLVYISIGWLYCLLDDTMILYIMAWLIGPYRN